MLPGLDRIPSLDVNALREHVPIDRRVQLAVNLMVNDNPITESGSGTSFGHDPISVGIQRSAVALGYV